MGAKLAEKVAGAQFTSHSTAVDVYVGFGFIPDYLRVVVDPGGTNSNLLEWYYASGFFSLYAVAGHLLTTGSSGNRTKVTTAGQIIEAYAGHEKVTTAEVVSTDPNHVSRAGTPTAANGITLAGVLIPKEAQVNSAVNLLIAYRIG